MMLPNSLTSRLTYFNINESVLADYQILCLPENFFSGEKEELYDAVHAVHLSKMLKQKDVKCANSHDLGLECEVAFRQSGDLYLGLQYVATLFVIPFLVNIISSLAFSKINGDGKKPDDKDTTNVSIELYLPKGEHLKYTGDSETLIKILNSLRED